MRFKLPRIRNIVILLLMATSMLTSSCADMFNKDYFVVTEQEDEYFDSVLEPSVQEVRSYIGMKNAIELLVSGACEYGVIRAKNYNGNAQEDISRACHEVRSETPLGVFAVDYMRHNPRQILTYYEFDVNITYKRSKAEIENIVKVSSSHEFYDQLNISTDNFEKSLVIQLASAAIDDRAILSYTEERYRSHPELIPELPRVSVNAYPNISSVQKIMQIEFLYSGSAEILDERITELNLRTKEYSKELRGMSSAETVLNICLKLMEVTSIYQGDDKKIPSTAYGALVRYSADSEGFAMAFKLLCNELKIECQVIEGWMNRETHYWNIVKIGGSYYHIDTYMCLREGIETAFLKRDADMLGSYWWGAEIQYVCDGELDYETLMDQLYPPEDTEDEEENE